MNVSPTRVVTQEPVAMATISLRASVQRASLAPPVTKK